MFLAKPGVYEPCGIFNIGHLVMILISIIGISIAVKCTKVNKKEDLKRIIRILTIIIWVLEILKTIFVISIGEWKNLNRIVPLYYCSLLLYTGLLSSVAKGKLERTANVFLATGGIFGGIVFILYPSTSLPEYPMFHFVSIHSFFFHSTMVYLGVIINKFKYVEVKMSDLKYYASLILVICILAYMVNTKYGSNLMFISQDFPGMPVSILYNGTGKWFTPIMVIAHMTIPFLCVYWLLKLKKWCMKKKMKLA